MTIVLDTHAINRVQGARQFARAERIRTTVDEGTFVAKYLTPGSSGVPLTMHIIAIIVYLSECAQDLPITNFEG